MNVSLKVKRISGEAHITYVMLDDGVQPRPLHAFIEGVDGTLVDIINRCRSLVAKYSTMLYE